MSSKQTAASKAQQQRAILQQPRQPSVPGTGRTRATKYNGPHKNMGAILAERAAERSGQPVEEPERSPAGAQKEPADTADVTASADGHSLTASQINASRVDSPKSNPHGIPDDIFTPPGSAASEPQELVDKDATAAEAEAKLRVLKTLAFKKRGPPEETELSPQEPMSATQATRAVALAAARAQYNDVKDLYDKHLEHVTSVEAKSRNGAIDKAMLLSRAYLVELHAEMKANEAALLEALKGSNPEVVFVPTHVDPPVISRDQSRHNHTSANKRKGHSDTGPCLFHVIPNWKEASMSETATLLHLSSLLSDRRFEQFKDEPHAFGARAWNRLDDLMYRSLRRFVGDDGRFKPQSRVNWDSMTAYFQEEFALKKLAPLFMLDLLSETHRPGLSLGLEGLVMGHVEVESVKLYKLNSPAMESFRALWGQTEGPAYPVTDRGASLYPETAGQQKQAAVASGQAAPPDCTQEGDDEDEYDDGGESSYAEDEGGMEE
ncbi:hypothetical protein DFH28DRAFT_940756 [Melampsora americana]|nr:hypothetical protein DFH28DRAFT_940756 [Melampsora americana]